MQRFLITLLLTYSTCSFGQHSKIFDIQEFNNIDSLTQLSFDSIKVDQYNIFEDSFYVVSKSCSGELGGTIKFKNKISGIEYCATSTCPIVVNKLNGKYYITNTLAHLRGHSEIIEIRNPDLMSIFKVPRPHHNIKGQYFYYIGDIESKSKKGTKQIIDSVGVLILATFPFNGQLYNIVTDNNETYISIIDEKRLFTIDTLSKKSLWTDYPEVYVTKNRHFIVRFDNQETKGYIDIFENKIKVYLKK